ncbi:MAG TPA: zinc-dependent alcohol dehydrogenase family protein [Candidatus Angelobacter sp.]|nr:zinc-dependent alcohol dehydrogenase family protein [Candidatus Angelobacter sp.]
MKAWTLENPAPIERDSLKLRDVPIPQPGEHEVLVKVSACGMCRTDLHVIEGELPPKKPHIIPGHQVVGVIEKLGAGAVKHQAGARVGIPWLHKTDGTCAYCRSGRENLCDFPEFTGYTVDGGYAEYTVAHEDFVYPIPEGFADLAAAPLLCAGIIGFRCLRVSGIGRGGALGIYGFGAAGHVCIQVARHWGAEVFVCTREEKHRRLALELGARWAGGAHIGDEPPEKLDASIIFAPAGELVPPALAALKKGGALVLGGIHMSPIPQFPYPLIYQERSIRSVANNTRDDGRDFIALAAKIPIHTEIQVFPLDETNRALQALKNDGIRGAGVIKVG